MLKTMQERNNIKIYVYSYVYPLPFGFNSGSGLFHSELAPEEIVKEIREFLNREDSYVNLIEVEGVFNSFYTSQYNSKETIEGEFEKGFEIDQQYKKFQRMNR